MGYDIWTETVELDGESKPLWRWLQHFERSIQGLHSRVSELERENAELRKVIADADRSGR